MDVQFKLNRKKSHEDRRLYGLWSVEHRSVSEGEARRCFGDDEFLLSRAYRVLSQNTESLS